MRFDLTVDGETFVDSAGTIQLTEATGQLARPNRVHARFKVRVASTVTLSLEIITIGHETWSTNLITGAWGAAPQEFAYNPSILFDSQGGVGPVMDRVTDADRLDDEALRDREMFRIRANVDADTIGPLTSYTLTGAPVVVELWIDQANYDLLRASLTGTSPRGGDQPVVWTLDLSDQDDPMSIEPPSVES